MQLNREKKIYNKMLKSAEKVKYLELLWKDLVRLPVEDAMYILNYKFEGISNKIESKIITWWFALDIENERYIKLEAGSQEEAVEKISTFMRYKCPKETIGETDITKLA